MVYGNQEIKEVYYNGKQIQAVYLGNRPVYNSLLYTSSMFIERFYETDYTQMASIDGTLYQINKNTLEMSALGFEHTVNLMRGSGAVVYTVSDAGIYKWTHGELSSSTLLYPGKWDDIYFSANAKTFLLQGTDVYQVVSGEPVIVAQNVSFISNMYYISNGTVFNLQGSSTDGLPSNADWVCHCEAVTSVTTDSISSRPGVLLSLNGVLIWYRAVLSASGVSGYVEEWRSSDGRDYSRAQVYVCRIMTMTSGGRAYLLNDNTLVEFFIDKDLSVTLSVKKQICSKLAYPFVISAGAVTDLSESAALPPEGNYYIDVASNSSNSHSIFRTFDNRFFWYSETSGTVQELSLQETE